jgi:D-alanyl-D-alanine carboxypeptidase
MTAIVAIEKGDLNREVIITKDDIDTYGSSIYLKEGDRVSLLDLLYGLMLRSGNDASKAIARIVGGSLEKFVFFMNEKAKEIGMNNSIFNNPSGLDVDEEGNMSSSYDLALLMSYAIKNPVFLDISKKKEYKSEFGVWANKNKLLRNYKKTIAGKTGFTYKAKRTLVSAAKDDETIFVVVTLDCGNDFNFHKFLYENNFNKYESRLILAKGENYFPGYKLICSKDIYVTLETKDVDKYYIEHKINNDNSLVYLSNDNDKKQVGKCDVLKNEVKHNKRSFFKRIFSK